MGQGQSGALTPSPNPNPNPGGSGSGQRKCSPAKVKRCLRTFLAHLFSHIGLCVLIVGYTVAGAFMFTRLEEPGETARINNRTNTFKALRMRYVHELWNITEQFNVLYEMNWTSAVEKELRKFESQVAAAATEEGYDKENKQDDKHWTFTGALLYSVSIITTIGYGNTVPRTAWGKILTMFYAVIGVPLMLLWLSNIGTLMANTFKFVYAHVCCPTPTPTRSVHNKRPSKEPSSIQVKYSVSAMTCETQVVQVQPQRVMSRKEQRAALRSLDPAAKQVLMECAEYNVNMDEDERSRRILHQLHQDVDNANAHAHGLHLEDESSDEVESVIDLRGLPPNDHDHDHDLGDLRVVTNNGCGGSVVGIGEGTPSRIPLLHKGGLGEGNNPDLVEMEALDNDNGEGGYESRPLSEQRVPVSLVLVFVVLYILGGAVVFSLWEQWEFLDSAYFCFITLSTIGLGDYVPGRSLNSAETKEEAAQLIVCCLYLVLGLAIIAMSFNLVQEEVAAKVKDVARHIGIIKDNEERH